MDLVKKLKRYPYFKMISSTENEFGFKTGIGYFHSESYEGNASKSGPNFIFMDIGPEHRIVIGKNQRGKAVETLKGLIKKLEG